MKNKGFTMVELLAVIAILGIMTGLAISAYTRYKEKTKNNAYDIMASSASSAAESYIMDHSTATSVYFDTLIEEGYLENTVDPGNSNDICKGKVVIKKGDLGTETKLQSNKYSVSLCCNNYNYTYEYPNGDKYIDKYCKGDPEKPYER